MKNDMLFITTILAIPLCIVVFAGYNRYNSFNEACEKCIKAGGHPITERGVYKFCMKRDYVLEVK